MTAAPPLTVKTGSAVIDSYLQDGYLSVVGMSSRFAAAIAARLMHIQTGLGVSGAVAEIGTFEGRFFIALAHALAKGEKAVGIDTFDWPNPEVIDRFHANCRKHGVPENARVTLKADSREMKPETVLNAAGDKIRLFHIDGEHSRHALTRDLALATSVMADGGLIILDDMLHPGYPTLMVAVQDYLVSNPDMVVLAVIDRESIVAATKFVLCQASWFKRYEEVMLEAFKDNIWPLGADFEPHWCLVLSLDTRLADIT
ncbi:MAG: class I SAM-dependent methyltransferase [Beijerinckiaceae bacterium]